MHRGEIAILAARLAQDVAQHGNHMGEAALLDNKTRPELGDEPVLLE